MIATMRNTILAFFIVIPGWLFAQAGPGLGNLTYQPSELYKNVWKYTEINHMGSTMATMHNGYLITTFHPDSGKPPGGILVWDVSNPRAPRLVKRVYDSRTSNFREMHALPQHGNYILFQDGCGFQIWDFSNPLDPVQVKRHCMNGYTHDDYGANWQMFWQAPYIYIANGSKGFDVVDASDIHNPRLVLHVNSPRQVGPIFAVGNLLVTSAHDFGKGITLYDISEPGNPRLLNSYSNTENMYASSLNGNQIVISARGNANNAVFSTYDISDPINIRKVGTLNIGNSGEQLYSSTQDNFIFQGCQSEVVKIDASDPSRLKIAGRGSLGIIGDSDHGQVSPMGNLIFVGNDHGTGSGFWVHQAAPDTKAPEVNMVVPRSNSVNQALTSRVGITLTDNILLESINRNSFIVRPVGGSALSGKYSYQFATINFFPDQPLQANTTYEIVIPAGGLKDLVGNPIEIPFKSYFSTGPTGSFPPGSVGSPWVFEESGNVSVYWNSVPNSTSYEVKRSLSPAGPFEVAGKVSRPSFTDQNVQNDSYYYYTVSASNSFGAGATSTIVRAMPSIYITDLQWTSATNGWGPAEIDQSNGENQADDGRNISLNGQLYSRGLGVHANSRVTYNLAGAYKRFLSDIGIDDEVGTSGSVVFSVLVDGVQQYTSGPMTGASEKKSINIDVSGAQSLTLIVDANGNNDLDHASWGGARLLLPARPYHGSAHGIPGRIEAEEYDWGGEGISYHELNSNGNEGKAPFRHDEVDIEVTEDVDGNYNIGYVLQGEWLAYSVDIATTALYDLELRVAADGDGKKLHIEMDGTDVTGEINIPNTNGWQNWSTVLVRDVELKQGSYEMRIVFDASYMNLNYIEFKDLITSTQQERISTIQIQPNPFSSQGITINMDTPFQYAIMDVAGNQLEAGFGDGTRTVGSQLAQGMYLLRIRSAGYHKEFKIFRN